MNEERNITSLIVGAVVIVLLFAMSPFTIVPAGSVGIVTQFSRPTGRILEPGFSWKLPLIQSVVDTNLRVVKDEISANAATKDLQDVTVRVAVNRQIEKEKVTELYNKVGKDSHLKDVVLEPAVQEVVKQVTAKYTAEELLTKRADVKLNIDEALLSRLKDYFVIVNDVSIVNFEFSKEFNNAIESKQIAEQSAKQALYEKDKVIIEKQAEVEQAKLDVEKARAQAEQNRLQTSALTPQILQKMWIDQWNGVLPQVVSDKSMVYPINFETKK